MAPGIAEPPNDPHWRAARGCSRLPRVLLDARLFMPLQSSRDSCAALIVTDGRQIRCQLPTRTEQLAAKLEKLISGT